MARPAAASVLELQRMAGNAAVARVVQSVQRAPDPPIAAPPSARDALREAQGVANDMLEEIRGGRAGPGSKPRDLRRLRRKLRDLANRSPPGTHDPVAQKAADLLNEIDDLEGQARAAKIERDRARGAPKTEERARKAQQKAAEGGERAEYAAKGGKAETTAVTKGAKSETTAVKAATKAEEALVKVEGQLMKAEGKLVRTAARLGALAEMLLPGPLDALMLLVDYAGAFAEAHDRIRRRNFRAGFTLGLATALVGLERPWMREHFARKFLTEDRVIAEVLGAVGLAEKEFNKGLDAGLGIGQTFPQSQKDVLVKAAFDAMGSGGYRVGSAEKLFSLETVARLGRALKPDVEAILDELEKFVYPIGVTTHRSQTGVVQDVPSMRTAVVTSRATWVNMSPGVRKLALISDTKTSIDSIDTGEFRKLDWIPERMVPLALTRTQRLFGKVETIDSIYMQQLKAAGRAR